MTIDFAIRLTEILLGIAFVQQSIEHLTRHSDERVIFAFRLLFSLVIILGYKTDWATLMLIILSLYLLYRIDGPYNGGADKMGLLVLLCLGLSYIAPSIYWRELAFGYLSVQLTLSYCISGYVKLINPQWRSGQALIDVFQFSAYPVSESIRSWANSPKILFIASWLVIVFECIFPLALLSNVSLFMVLMIAAAFHFVNACLFGLNRFFWVWLAAYPAIIWFQSRIFAASVV